MLFVFAFCFLKKNERAEAEEKNTKSGEDRKKGGKTKSPIPDGTENKVKHRTNKNRWRKIGNTSFQKL